MAELVASPDTSRASRLAMPLGLGAAVLIGSVALHLRDPHTPDSWGFCPFRALTGWYCPGCGGLRAVNDLTNGHVGAALSSNLLFVSLIPLIVLVWGRSLSAAWTGQRRPLSARTGNVATTLFVVVALVFTVVRNTPWGSWLAP